jgi:Tfp pilus assembly protein PilV
MGFTMVEVIFAIMILAFGLLGMAGTTALVVRQVTIADLATERSAALQTTIERLRALPFSQLANGSDSVGIFRVAWTVTDPTGQWATLKIVTTGPGIGTVEGGPPLMLPAVPDTFEYRILR